jgi:hypothetical protein
MPTPRTVPPTILAPPVVALGDLTAATFLSEYVARGRPVVIRGALDGWAALERWRDVDYLVERAGDRTIAATNVESGVRAPMPLARFWRNTFEGSDDPHAYVNAVIVQDDAEGVLGNLRDDTRVGPFFDPADHRSTLVFAGRDTRSGLHFHPATEAYLCQVVGRKRALLFPPTDTKNLDPISWWSPHQAFSRIVFPRDGGWPDADRFPGLAATHPVEVELEPGDVLYIPIHWWHVVFGPDTAICATQMFRASLRKRFFTRMGLRSNYINGKVLRYNWHKLRGSWKYEA